MNRKLQRSTLAVCILGFLVAGNYRLAFAEENEPTIEVQLIRSERLPAEDSSEEDEWKSVLEIRIENRRNEPTWFLWPVLSEHIAFPKDGVFYPIRLAPTLMARRIQFESLGGKGFITTVSFFGRSEDTVNNGFLAVCLPANASLFLSGDWVIGPRVLQTFEVWEADSIKLDGKIDVEDWYPYDLLSSKVISANESTYQKAIKQDWEDPVFREGKDKDDVLREDFSKIIVSAVKKHRLKIK